MSNVLTAEGKKAIDARLRGRFLLATSLVLAGGAIIACLSLAPAIISVQVASASLAAPSEEAEAAREDSIKAGRAQSLIAALGPLVSATSSASVALGEALALQPADISITVITYTAESNTIVLSGLSKGREAVNDFRDALEASELFTDVAVPVAALVGTQQGRFTITLKGF
jgi:Tfp pilus assembly protein PilN